MPFRRLNDFAGIIIYVLGLVFLGGGVFAEIKSIRKTIDDQKGYMIRHDDIERGQDLAIQQLQLEAETRDKFYGLMKELLKETRDSNKETNIKINAISNTVLETKIKVEAIEKSIR